MEIFALNIFDNSNDLEYKPLLSQVDETKRLKILRFTHPKDLQRGLFAELLIRKLLIERCRLKNGEIRFSVNEYGKPYCDRLDDFHFNVSHPGDWVVCAVDRVPVGIDIEKISTIDLDISKNFFSPQEHQDLIQSNDPFEYFFTLWSLKESYIKFIGKGLSHPLNRFSMKMLSSSRIGIEVDNTLLEHIHFEQYSIDEGYKMAVCCSHAGMPEQVTMISKNELANQFLLLEAQY
jgi:4'-phosphopantetheinyl transferase